MNNIENVENIDNIGNFKILIVDDERSNINALKYALQSMCSIYVAIDGTTALEIARKVIPDLILLDVLMPDISGYDVLAELKRDNLTHRIPVIFITGLDSIEDEEKGFALGAADYITKPFNNAIVKARVKTQLQIIEYINTIEQLGSIDTLTNIPNRRGFDNRMNTEWIRSMREKEPISILMIDIDKFKLYNDTYGHLLGDNALKSVAAVIKKMLMRRTDVVSRWGGEEFIVLMLNTGLDGALVIAERIRAAVEREIIQGTNTSVTISIGVNSEIPTTQRTISDFISEADKALYAAKNSGRNRVCHCTTLSCSEPAQETF